MKIKKDDKVIILKGKDRGKIAKVLRAFPRSGQLIVEGVNMVKKHTKSRQKDKPGEIIEKTMPINVSNVSLIDPKDDKPTRVGYKFDNNGRKVRITKKGKTELK